MVSQGAVKVMNTAQKLFIFMLAVAATSRGMTAQTPARPPATTLKPAVAGTKPPTTDGFIQRWLLLEPVRTNAQLTDSAVQSAVQTNNFSNDFSAIPRDSEAVTAGGSELRWHAVDTAAYNVNLYHFAYALNKPTSNVLFWAVTVINVAEDTPGVRLAIGSNAASVWWVNGQEVIHIYGDRQSVIDDGVSKRLTLKKGANVIRAAIINAGGATDFCARFLNEDGIPVTHIATSLDAGK
jgi:hypothetical protein